MGHLVRTIPLSLALLFGVSGAFAQETSQWGSAGGWSIRVDHSVGHGCYIHGQYDSGTSLRLGYEPQAGGMYVMLGNPAWRSIEQGTVYELTLRFDQSPPRRIDATGVPVDGSRNALGFTLSEGDFLQEFMGRNVLTISYGNSEVDRLTLSGSTEAVEAMVQCQSQIDRAQRPDNDGTEEPPESPKDSLGSKPSQDPFF
jgi:hypothetical protein